MEPQDELNQLLDRQAALNQELKAKKKELQDAQRHQRANLQKQIRNAQARVSAADRKRRTRRLILMGSYLEHVTQNDPVSMARLMKGLDEFLERDRDRELFDLAPRGATHGRLEFQRDSVPSPISVSTSSICLSHTPRIPPRACFHISAQGPSRCV